jgi:membrane protease subunit HflK
MAWNEPGNGKQRDPWGGDQGPPDLDEAFRKFREKLGAAFGGGRGGSSSGGGNEAAQAGAVLAVILALVGAIWLYLGVHVIDEQERAVVLRFGRFSEILDPGLNWNPSLIDTVVPVNVTRERQYESSGMMLTQDENIVELPVKVQYNIADVKAFVLNVQNPEISLGHAADSALRHVVGSSKLEQVLSEGRAQIAEETRVKLQSYLDLYGAGIQIVGVTIQEAKPPREVKAAFDDVIKAKEDEERTKNEASAYANGMVPEARGRGQRALEEAAGYRSKVVADAEGEAQRFQKLLAEYKKAPAVMRERLYIDSMQRWLSGSQKVMVNVEGGNNVLYLPIDRLGNRTEGAATGPAEASSTRTTTPASTAQQVADEVVDRLRREAAAARSRESR